jgi:signal transduction histidine kinase
MENDWIEQRDKIIGLGENSFKKSYYPELQLKISELEASYKNLQKREALLSATQRLAKVGGWEYDIKSAKSFWTDELYRIHELPNNSEIDHLAESSKCYKPDDRQTILNAFERACKYGEPYDLEFQFTTFNGNLLWIRTTAQPVYEENNIVRLVGNVMDITALKQNEEEIRKLNQELEKRVEKRTEQLEAANKELEAFSYSVSHDLRAPLRSIDGFSHLLNKGYYEKLDDQGKNYLNHIISAAQRMSHLIDDMLKLSQITRSELNIQNVDLSAIVREIADNLRDSQPEREVYFHIAEGITTRGDAYLLRIVLENFIWNAWKFTSKHTKATIEFGVQQKKGQIAYYVRDDGAGFDMNYVQKLFGAFQRLHSENEFPGTGIGLATVQRIIQRHEGTVWAESEVEKGATFYFTINR